MRRLIACLLTALILAPDFAVGQDARPYAPSIPPVVQGTPGITLIDARDYGAACNGTTNDTAAIRAGLIAATARSPVGGVLSLPPGTCVLSDTIAATVSSQFTLIGAGRGATILQWTNPDGGMALTYTGQYNAPRIQGVSFHTTRAGGGTALTLTLRPAERTANALGPIVDDAEFRGHDTKADYWTDGVHLVDVWYGALSNFTVKGKDETVLPFSMASGVKYTRAQGFASSSTRPPTARCSDWSSVCGAPAPTTGGCASSIRAAISTCRRRNGRGPTASPRRVTAARPPRSSLGLQRSTLHDLPDESSAASARWSGEQRHRD